MNINDLWQPIETAPLNDEFVLIVARTYTNQHGTYKDVIYDPSYDEGKWQRWDNDLLEYVDIPGDVTHWMYAPLHPDQTREVQS